MKVFSLIISIIIVIVAGISLYVFLGIPKYISFSETSGRIVDISGNGIQDVTVEIEYSCTTPGFGGDIRKVQYGDNIKTITDKDGNFAVEGLNLGWKITNQSNCRKLIMAYKAGYCGNAHCEQTLIGRGEITNRFPEAVDPEPTLVKIGRYYYRPDIIWQIQFVNANQKEVQLILRKSSFVSE
ncbi:carboxypeptidase-like regulatory domain-containing protein [Candidatus Parcubacteria bacterium]|nr:carboxypeptidase-like regulatory domain-containing protein [Candidatus Parcubacteria bacterium]